MNGKKRNGKDGGWEASDVEIVCESVMSNACSKKVSCVREMKAGPKMVGGRRKEECDEDVDEDGGREANGL